MKKSNLLYFSLIVIVIQTSCVSTKDILMFQELKKDNTSVYLTPPPPEIRIKPFDNLYISISTVDPEVNRTFNPTQVGQGSTSGTSSNFGDPSSQYINGYRVNVDSTVTLPILGAINLVGLILVDAEKKVKMKAEEYLKDPSVKVKFLNYKVNVTGEIRTPGVYYNYEGSINMLDAISRANGITDFADLNNVIVKRQVENKIFTHKVNLTDNSVYSSEVFYLQPNDLIYIPPGNLKRRSTNMDTYSRFLGTISTLMVAAALFLNL